ncbi:hypothetical protein NE857_31520 [Nocardiopsis exhalans]|uniref:Uncharacterized protein n=1 Tax=Nocardiopsis exhalans TaxID=163604 RepID=A0ABY5D5V4_9ACTN|nr:hypothetical protein [Nocardiopsis exhalans]USY19709.1 hypothetical protein NE857_31520 [Nocardiopsis exhalans]
MKVRTSITHTLSLTPSEVSALKAGMKAALATDAGTEAERETWTGFARITTTGEEAEAFFKPLTEAMRQTRDRPST